jgi:hypothetical protein
MTLLGCSHELEQNVKPLDLIPKDSFTAVLKDMMILEAYVKTQKNNVHEFHKALPASADSVFESHNIDSARYISSMGYYSKEQEILLDIYTEIQDEIVLESADLKEKE